MLIKKTLRNAQLLERTALGRFKNGYRGQLTKINILILMRAGLLSVEKSRGYAYPYSPCKRQNWVEGRTEGHETASCLPRSERP